MRSQDGNEFGAQKQSEAEQSYFWTMEDLSLMNHYTRITAATLPGASLLIWQHEIPKQAVSYPFLMHQILAVSAFHLANLEPSQRLEHLSQGFRHQYYAIGGIREEVVNVTPENCNALFAASSLLSIGAFGASTPAVIERNGIRQQRDLDSILEAFGLIRGVGSILNSPDTKAMIKDGVLGEFMQCDAACSGGTNLLHAVFTQLSEVEHELSASLKSESARASVETAVAGLRKSIEKSSSAAPELNVIMIWPMTLDEGFMSMVRVLHPAALVILAHYCVVLDAANVELWFMQGWGSQLITAIANCLAPAWHESIRWPTERLKSKTDGLCDTDATTLA